MIGLAGERSVRQGVLAYGVKRRLAIGIALMADPRSCSRRAAAGMNGRETTDFIALIQGATAGSPHDIIVEHRYRRDLGAMLRISAMSPSSRDRSCRPPARRET